ncbi:MULTISPECIES: hypothetical protein [Enterobacteriaceae]|uniref:hypothetical protein n=1 Tax=Enterobacteriaceae TaxID=543 RepID=UPI000CF09200|nr:MULTISPECIES: hypothetical protein [Enterobacteriaceae]MCE9977276.1 hypothetical protein [Leclercia adecarboxylata]PPY04499.1 hypothetical protein C3D67_18430 [Cronobacter sakazakii]WNY85566.1 hypothetical protein NRF19_02085 [Leclercia adecarboxylata]
MDLDELDAARIELVGDEFGSKGKFAKLLGLSGHHSLRGYYRRGSIPRWIEVRIRDLLAMREMRLAEEAKKEKEARARKARRVKREVAIFEAGPVTDADDEAPVIKDVD